MGSKAEYEARKATREKMRNAREALDEQDTDIMLMDTLDRIATAFERIADAMESKIIYEYDSKQSETNEVS